MRLLLMLSLLFASLVLLCSGAENATRKTLRTVKALKKSSSAKRLRKTTAEQDKSESYHVPLIVSAPEGVPVSLEVHDDDHHIRTSPDIRPIRPIHLVPLGQPQSAEARQFHDEGEEAYRGPVAVPLDYPYGNTQDVARGPYDSDRKRISPGEYYSEHHHHEDLSSIPGSPGIDYPTLADLPHTGFRCLMHTPTPGFYADVETKCQMWHYCQPDGRHDRFLCPNGTIFDQTTRVCNWWFNVHCEASLEHYDVNFDLYREPFKVPHQTLDVAQAPAPYLGTPSVTHPNSFLRHVADFEATRHSNLDHPQGIIEASYPVHSVVHRYPDSKMDSDHRYPDSKIDDSHPTFHDTTHHYGHHDSNIDPVHQIDTVNKNPDLIIDSIHPATNDGLHHYRQRDSKTDLSHQDIDIHHENKDDSYLRPIHQHHRYPAKMAPSPLVRHDAIDYDSSNAHSSLSTPGEKHGISEVKKNQNEAEDHRLPLKKRKRISRRKLRKNHPRNEKSRQSSDDTPTDIPTYREAKATPAARRYRIVRRRKVNKA